MFRTFMSITILSVAVLTASTAVSDEAEKCAGECTKGKCSQNANAEKVAECSSKACTGETCEGEQCTAAKTACSASGTCTASSECAGNKSCEATGKCAAGETCATSQTCSANKQCQATTTCSETGQCSASKSCAATGTCAASATSSEGCCSSSSEGCCSANGTCQSDATCAADDACETAACISTAAKLIKFGAIFDCCATTGDAHEHEHACGSEGCCESASPCVSFVAVEANGQCTSCPPSECVSSSEACGCGDGCSCCGEADEQILGLHTALIEEKAENAILTARLEFQEELAASREELLERLYKKEVELVHMHSEIQRAGEHNDRLTHELAQTRAHHANAVATAQAANVKLNERVAKLEKLLETINVRLAKQPAYQYVK